MSENNFGAPGPIDNEKRKALSNLRERTLAALLFLGGDYASGLAYLRNRDQLRLERQRLIEKIDRPAETYVGPDGTRGYMEQKPGRDKDHKSFKARVDRECAAIDILGELISRDDNFDADGNPVSTRQF